MLHKQLKYSTYKNFCQSRYVLDNLYLYAVDFSTFIPIPQHIPISVKAMYFCVG
jgi:hypothetical protein